MFILAAPSVYPLMTPCPRANQSCWHSVSKHRNSSRVPVVICFFASPSPGAGKEEEGGIQRKRSAEVRQREAGGRWGGGGSGGRGEGLGRG